MSLKQTWIPAFPRIKLLSSVGKYIKVNKGKAHPDAIKVLNSVFTSLEKVLLSKDIAEGEREKILLIKEKRK